MKRALLAMVALLAALGVAEGALRQDEGTLTFRSDGRRFATRPGTRGTNSRGFHEREFSDTPSQRRYVVLGDSVTHGLGAPEDAWPRRAELATPGSEWLNLAHYGYDAAQSLAVLRTTPLHPAVVLYAAYVNDLVPSVLITVGDHGWPEYLGEGGLFPASLRQRSALLRHLDGAWMARRVRELPDPDAWEAAVVAMKAEATAQGASFGIVGLVPHVLANPKGCLDALGMDGCRATAAASATFEDAARRLHIPFLDTTEALRASGRPNFYAEGSTDPHHPSAEGQAVIGAAVAAWAATFPPAG